MFRSIFFLFLVVATQSAGAKTPQSLAETLLVELSQKTPKDAAVCASVDGADISSELLKRLAQKDSRFVAASECKWVTDIDRGSYHPATGRKAYFASVSSFSPTAGARAEVKTSLAHHGLWGIHKTLVVEEDGGQWKTIFGEEPC